MEAEAIFQTLKDKFGNAVTGLATEGCKPPFMEVSPSGLREVAGFLRDHSSLRFDSLMCLSGVDYKDRFAVAYHLYSMSERHSIGVKVTLPRESPAVPSVDDVWPAANFMEREAFDLFGIVFTGSRDLRRILLPEDWEGHPLRKDYVYPESYHGIKV